MNVDRGFKGYYRVLQKKRIVYLAYLQRIVFIALTCISFSYRVLFFYLFKVNGERPKPLPDLIMLRVAFYEQLLIRLEDYLYHLCHLCFLAPCDEY